MASQDRLFSAEVHLGGPLQQPGEQGLHPKRISELCITARTHNEKKNYLMLNTKCFTVSLLYEASGPLSAAFSPLFLALASTLSPLCYPHHYESHKHFSSPDQLNSHFSEPHPHLNFLLSSGRFSLLCLLLFCLL